MALNSSSMINNTIGNGSSLSDTNNTMLLIGNNASHPAANQILNVSQPPPN